MFRKHALMRALAVVCVVSSAQNLRAEDSEQENRSDPSVTRAVLTNAPAPQLTVTSESFHDILQSLRDTPSVPHEGARIHFEGLLPPVPGPQNLPDGAIQHTFGPTLAVPTPASNFDGLGNGFTGFTVNSAPPDTVGAVGATQYVQVVNSSMVVFNKTTRAVVLGPITTKTLWSGFGGGCQTNNDGDGVVLYDHAADRWVVSQFSVSTTPYLECVAVSQTNDATGAWNRYAFSYGNTDFTDYPKMGVWPDGYYTTYNVFHGNTFAGAKVCAFDRAKMLTGAAATQQCFQLTTADGGMLPSDWDGATAPPANSPNYVLELATTASLKLFKFHVDWANTANTTFSSGVSIPVASFAEACGGGTCIPQSSTTNQLDSLADRLMHRLAYRNNGGTESLVVSHSVTAGSSTGLRWYEIRNPGAASPTVFQQSTFAPDSSFRWMPSIAMDQQGNMMLGYSISSSSSRPSINYTGRLATDVVSTMQAEAVLQAGAGSQTGGLTRWGDYSAMTVDPTDDCTFWFTTEYMKTTGSFNWNTRIGSFKFPTCGAVVTHTVTPSVTGSGTITPNTPQTVNHGATTAFTVTANANNHLVNVTGTCGGNLVGTTYTTNAVNADCTVIANFAVDTHVVTPSVTGNGSITPNTPQTVNHGATTAFTVTANANNHLVNVTGTCGGNLVGTTYTTNAVNADCTVIANFAIDTHVVTPSVTGSGSITPNTPQTVNHGATTAFTVTANANNHLVNVTGTCGGNLVGTTYTTNAVNADCTVIANFAIDTHVVTPSVTGSGSITPNTPQTVNHGATTAFTVTANANNHLVNVTGTCGGNLVGTTYTTNAVNADCTVIANFAVDTHVVTPSVSGNGSITPNTPQTVNHGATTAFTVTANANNHLVNVTGTCGGALVGTTYTTNAVNADCTVIANFAVDTHVVTPSVTGSGTITPNTPQTVNHGATTAFIVAANANNHLVNVTGTCGGNLVGTTYTTNAVTADCTVIANFAIDTHTVTPSVTGNGTITPNTPQTVNHGATTAFTVAASANNHLVNVTGTCGGNLVGTTYTTNAVTADCTVIANFAIDTHTVTPSVTGNGTITPNTPQTVNHGATTAFTIAANANNHVVNVTGTCGGNLVGTTYTTNAVNADCTVIANFAIDTHVVTPSVSGNGTITPNTPQTVNHGATTAFTIAANANNHVVNVTGTCGGNLVGTTYTTNAVNADCTVIANFAIDTHVVTPSVTGSGTITPNTPQTVNHGATTAFTIAANANNHVVNVTGTCGGNLVGTTYTTNAVNANCTVIANFAIDTHTVTPSVSGSGSITPNTPQTVNHGATTAFTITANAGNHIANVTGTCGGNLVGNTYTTNAVNADCTVIANFAANVLVFTTQPIDVTRGNALATVVVTEQDGSGNTIPDNATVAFTTSACSAPLNLGSVAMSNGVATLNSNQRFYTLASGLSIGASSGSLTATSGTFNIVAGTDSVFADGLEGCRP
jgi:hypothetical protein